MRQAARQGDIAQCRDALRAACSCVCCGLDAVEAPPAANAGAPGQTPRGAAGRPRGEAPRGWPSQRELHGARATQSGRGGQHMAARAAQSLNGSLGPATGLPAACWHGAPRWRSLHCACWCCASASATQRRRREHAGLHAHHAASLHPSSPRWPPCGPPGSPLAPCCTQGSPAQSATPPPLRRRCCTLVGLPATDRQMLTRPPALLAGWLVEPCHHLVLPLLPILADAGNLVVRHPAGLSLRAGRCGGTCEARMQRRGQQTARRALPTYPDAS